MTNSCQKCGHCCRSQVCDVYVCIFGATKPPCPALTSNNLCELVEKGFGRLLGIGIGCDSKGVKDE